MGATRNSEGGTYNWYGGTAREVEIQALEAHGAFLRLLRKGVPRDEACIKGRFAYTTKHKPSKDGHARTDVYIDGHRRLDALFRVKDFKRRSGHTLLPRQESYIV